MHFCYGSFIALDARRVNGIIPFVEMKALIDIYEVEDVVGLIDMIAVLDKELGNIEASDAKKHTNRD